jgi:hypothetical protein
MPYSSNICLNCGGELEVVHVLMWFSPRRHGAFGESFFRILLTFSLSFCTITKQDK